MTSSPARSGTGSRAATRALRRQQLIQSTIESIARRGFADTTLATVAAGAGLSRGIVNFHFQSKEQLLVETLRFLAGEYMGAWKRALANAGPSAAERLRALVAVNFDAAVCNRKKISVWFAFFGESKSRPMYRELCGAMDQEYFDAALTLCTTLVAEGDYDLDPRTITRGLSAMIDGLWLDQLTTPESFHRDTAREAVALYLSRLFPRHFSGMGALAA